MQYFKNNFINIFCIGIIGILFFHSYNLYILNQSDIVNNIYNLNTVYYLDRILLPFFLGIFYVLFSIKKYDIKINKYIKYIYLFFLSIIIGNIYYFHQENVYLFTLFRGGIIFLFIEIIMAFFKKAYSFKNINIHKTRISIFILLSSFQFFSYKYGFISDNPALLNESIFSHISENFLYIFYNPVLPIIDITLLQILFFTVSFIFFNEIKKNIYSELNKADLYKIFFIICIGLSLTYCLSHNVIWESNYHQMSYSYYADIDNIFSPLKYLDPQIYGIAFHDFLNIFSKINLGFGWNIYNTFFINKVVNICNIILIYILSYVLWNKKIISYFTALFYATSIPVITYFSGEHTYILATSLLMMLVFGLVKYHQSEYKNDIFLLFIFLISILLFHIHHQFILVPFISIIFFIIHYNKNIVNIFKGIHKYLLYIFGLLFMFSAFLIKINLSYISDKNISDKNNIIEILSTVSDISFIGKMLLTKINPFLNINNNSIYIIILLFFAILITLIAKKRYKIIIFLFLLHVIIFFPHFYTYHYSIDNIRLLEIQKSLTYGNSFLTDYTIKGSTTFFIYILFLGIPFYYLLSYIPKRFKRIIIVFITIGIIIVPILNKEKIIFYFNPQNNYLYFEHILKTLKSEYKNNNFDLYYENNSYGYTYLGNVYDINIKSEIKNIDWGIDNYYYLSSYCYQYHQNKKYIDKSQKCNIFGNEDIIYTPILEKNFECKAYIVEQKCNEDIMKLGLYKMTKNIN